MLKEFAVDPAVIASSYEICRYLISQFGADKGRLISRYPKTWKRMAFDAASRLPDGLRKERVVESINNLDREWLTLTTSNRPYTAPADPWLVNARAAHAAVPFAAIICDQDDLPNRLIDARSCDERNPLFVASNSVAVRRSAQDLADVGKLLLRNCRALRLIDPYFKPLRLKWRRSLGAMLALIPDISSVHCEYHVQEKDNSPATNELKQHLRELAGFIPVGGTLRIVRWQEQEGGERFHRRYLLIENAGLYFEGLDEEVRAAQTTDVYLVGKDLHARRWAEYNAGSTTFRPFGPVLIVDSDGNVTEET